MNSQDCEARDEILKSAKAKGILHNALARAAGLFGSAGQVRFSRWTRGCAELSQDHLAAMRAYIDGMPTPVSADALEPLRMRIKSGETTKKSIAKALGVSPSVVERMVFGGAVMTESQLAVAQSVGAKQDGDGALVYFIQAVIGGPIKIGASRTPESRLTELQSYSPFALRILATLPGGFEFERELHARFAPFRSHGEWFTPNGALLALVEGANGFTTKEAEVSHAA